LFIFYVHNLIPRLKIASTSLRSTSCFATFTITIIWTCYIFCRSHTISITRIIWFCLSLTSWLTSRLARFFTSSLTSITTLTSKFTSRLTSITTLTSKFTSRLTSSITTWTLWTCLTSSITCSITTTTSIWI